MKLLITALQLSPPCPVPASSQNRPSVNAVDRLFDVFENGERRLLVSQGFLFAQYVLASNSKTVVAPEVSKPELQSPSFWSQVATEKGLGNKVPLNGSGRGVSEDGNFQRLSRAASRVGRIVRLSREAELPSGLAQLK